MIGNLPRDKAGNIELPVSSYSPSEEVKVFTGKIKEDYLTGYTILHQSYNEFDGLSMLEIMERDQKRYNVFVGAQSDDPDEKWRFHGIRPIARNKVIQMAARIIGSMFYPQVFAQNDASEEDKAAAYVMRDLIEWNIRNSDYEISFLYNVIAMLVNPVAYINVEFVEAMQTIKEKMDSGKISTKQVVDEVMSGLQIHNVPADEILISNAYEHNLQKQRFLIRKKFIEYEDSKAKYGEHEDFKSVQPGIRALYNEEDGLFYDQSDPQLRGLVEECIYFNRLEDTEVPYLNGIYLGDKNVNDNPIKHRRCVLSEKGEVINIPIYPYVKGGFEPIDERRFFFYKSLISKMWWDDQLVNRMWQLTMDGTFMAIMPPIGISGETQISSSVMVPGGITALESDSTRFTPLSTGANLNAGFAAIQKVEQSLAESSQDNIVGGVLQGAKQTATANLLAQQNARIQLGLFGRMVGQMVKEIGQLMVDIIVHHQTVGQTIEATGEIKYKTFILPNQSERGQKISKKIEFQPGYLENPTPEMLKSESYKIMNQEGGVEGKMRLYKVNPEKFARLKFMLFIEPDQMEVKSKELEWAMKREDYAMLIQNPLIAGNPDNLEAVTRDFILDPRTNGESDKYLKKAPQQMQPNQPNQTNQPLPRPTQNGSLPQQITGQNALSRLVSGGAQ